MKYEEEEKMMECSCAISIDHDCGAELMEETLRTARKIHRCCECGKTIQIGETYEYVKGMWEGDWNTYKTCLDCKSIRDVFFDSWIYTEIWENFRDEFGCHGSVIPENCITELTPGARARVCEFIESMWEEK